MQSFNRVEQKYILSKEKYRKILHLLKNYLINTEFPNTIIENIYYDTDNFDLIRISMDKPIYKEKFRIRSYGIPKLSSKVFLEIKKKYKKEVNKRRISLTLKDAYNFIKSPNNINSQVSKELSYIINYYHLKPMIFISYNRISFYSKEDNNFRLTFDCNLRYRIDNLKLEYGNYGNLYFDYEPYYIMEVKCNGAYPLWFTHYINLLNIYPTSFSKYGNVYRKIMKGVEEIYV